MLIRQPQSSMAAHSSTPFSNARSSGYCVVSFPRRRLHHVPLLLVPLTYVAVTCVARSLTICLSPIAIGRTADPAMAARAHVPWRLKSSPGEPRAPTSVAAGGARASRLAAGSHPSSQSQLAQPSSPMLHMYVLSVSDVLDVCCNYFISMLQKWIRGCCTCYICCKCFRGMLQAFVQNISSISIHLLQSFLSRCCICFTYMLQ
jgi:hypothetical protein